MQWSTGNRTVDAVGQMDFSGNLTPRAWYATIKTEGGKPDLVAITMLSEIVYWYRPGVQARVEGGSGSVRRYCKFAADKLQMGYRHFEEQFGLTRDQCKRAFVRLEALGVVRREQREIVAAGQRVSAMFVGLDADVLKKLTYPDETPNLPGSVENSSEINDTVLPNVENSPENTKACLANVENSVENSDSRGGAVQKSTARSAETPPTPCKFAPPYTENTQKIKKEKTLGSSEPSEGSAARRVLEGHTALPREVSEDPVPSQGFEWSHAQGAYVRSKRLESLPSYPDRVPCFACGCDAHKTQKAPSCRTYVCDSCGTVWTEPPSKAAEVPQIRDFEDGWE